MTFLVRNFDIYLIGPAPGKRARSRRAFDGDTASGRRFPELLGISRSVFFDIVRTTNLLQDYPGTKGRKGDGFDLAAARIRAKKLLPKLRPNVALLAGRNVARAFGISDWPYFLPYRKDGCEFHVVPHPSGLNQFWNHEANRLRAGHFLCALVMRAVPFSLPAKTVDRYMKGKL